MGSVSFIKNGKIIHSYATGYTNIITQAKASIDTRYRIGSISKTFTAVLTFQAIELGHIQLNYTIEKYFPEIVNSNKITFADLLQH